MNLIATSRASQANYHDASRARPYLYWVIANVPAFLWVAGVAQTALLAYQTRCGGAPAVGFETVFLGVLALSSISGVFLGEVDHIWLFFIPPLAAIAGMGLDACSQRGGRNHAPRRDCRLAGAATLIQVLLYVLVSGAGASFVGD